MAAIRAHGALLQGGFGAGIFADDIRSYGVTPVTPAAPNSSLPRLRERERRQAYPWGTFTPPGTAPARLPGSRADGRWRWR